MAVHIPAQAVEREGDGAVPAAFSMLREAVISRARPCRACNRGGHNFSQEKTVPFWDARRYAGPTGDA